MSAFAIFVKYLKFFQTYLWYLSPQPINSVVNFCFGRADEQQHIYFDYKMGMNDDTFNSVVDGTKVVLVICLIAVTSGKLFILNVIHKLLSFIYYSNPEKTVHSTHAKIYYFYRLTHPGSLIIMFGTFWDPLTLRTQLLVTE